MLELTLILTMRHMMVASMWSNSHDLQGRIDKDGISGKGQGKSVACGAVDRLPLSIKWVVHARFFFLGIKTSKTWCQVCRTIEGNANSCRLVHAGNNSFSWLGHYAAL